MSTGFLMVVPDMLVGERLATPGDLALERFQLIMACLDMLGQI
jgi:hypothetical protein